ncbi:MAG: PAS domain S-box protein [bacterium]
MAPVDDEVLALRQSEQYYRDLVDAANDALFVHDATGRILAVNEGVCNLFGYTREEALAATIGDMSSNEPPFTDEDAREMVARAAHGGSHTFEWHSRRKNGELFWSEVTLRGANLAGQERIIASVRDISQRKRQDETLRESEERFQMIFNSSSNAIAFTEPANGRIIDVNETWVSETGISRAFALGKSALELGLWSDRADRARAIDALSRDGHLREFEARLTTGREYAINAELVDTRTGRGILWEFRDITEKRRVLLEQDVLRAQLYEAQRMESVGRLAGGVAHDFNNLLTVILSLAKMMGEAPRNEADADDLQQIIAAAERAATLTRQLLAFARRQIVEPKVLDLNMVVGSVDEMLRRLIGENIDLSMQYQAGLGAIKADYGQLEQVLMNLAVNASDAMERGGTLVIATLNVTIDDAYAATHPDASPGEYVMMRVTDTGTGIDPVALPHVFDPFFTTKKAGKGTGLGLSTCYGIVRQHGGFIRVQSEPGKGATFDVCFPRDWSQVADRAEATLETPVPGGGRLLVVEDDSMLRRIAVRVLQKQGYTVMDSADGVQAILRFEEIGGRIDLLITDIVMPHMSGKELAVELTRRSPSLKVLYTSGYTENTIVHHGVVDAGVNFLPKPYIPSDLVRRVREVLES